MREKPAALSTSRNCFSPACAPSTWVPLSDIACAQHNSRRGGIIEPTDGIDVFLDPITYANGSISISVPSGAHGQVEVSSARKRTQSVHGTNQIAAGSILQSFTPGGTMSYARFGVMIAVSTVVMFGLMYLNTYALDHVWFSQTRAWMAVVMGATMAVIMMGFMMNMYPDKRANLAIIAGGVLAFAGSLWLVRSQATVYDVSYMKAMIPHHSIAVMTSERAHIRDPRVRKLADEIIESQMREIGEMKNLIADLERNKVPDDYPDLPPDNTGNITQR
jgi:hypothetical protein